MSPSSRRGSTGTDHREDLVIHWIALIRLVTKLGVKFELVTRF
jgi:hypothetical protein